MIVALYDRDLHSQIPEVLRHLKPYVPTACKHGATGPLLLDERTDAERILDGTEREQPAAIQPLKTRPSRLRPWSEEELVVWLLEYSISIEIMDGNDLPIRIDRGNLMMDLHRYAEARPEALWRLKRKLAAIGYDPADIVRQSAVGV